MNYLKNSKEIKASLTNLFSGNSKKWAIVAFVGYDAISHLPQKVSNLSVICWPKAGGTNPDGVRRLLNAGIEVFFCEKLHQKVYWSEGKGVIIGSANLSTNALGENGLHEYAVHIPDRKFDINSILRKLKRFPVKETDLQKLDVEHNALASRARGESSANRFTTPSFLEARNTNFRRKIKFAFWMENRSSSEQKALNAIVREDTLYRSYANDVDTQSPHFEPGDFVLTVKLGDDGKIQRANAEWLCVQHIIRRGRNDHVLIQLDADRQTEAAPFLLNSEFKKYLKEVFNAKNPRSSFTEKDQSIKNKFLDEIAQRYHNSTV